MHSEKSKVDEHVEQILLSSQFERSPALKALLEHLRDVNGPDHKDSVSEYSIAQDLLGQKDFDPRSNPIVRVQMNRLRDALDRFATQNPGPVRLTIPRGTYRLVLQATENTTVEPASTAPDREPRMGLSHLLRYKTRWLLGGVIASAIAVAGAVAFRVWVVGESSATGYPMVEVLPFENLSGEADLNVFETGLQRQLATDLQRFGYIRTIVRDENSPLAEAPDFLLVGNILELKKSADLTFRLERNDDRTLVYSGRIMGPILGNSYFDTIFHISKEISGGVASRGGVRSNLAAESDGETISPKVGKDGVGLNVFNCMMLGDNFFDSYSPDEFVTAYRCFEKVMPELADDPIALAAWGTMKFHTVPEFDLMDTSEIPSYMWNDPLTVLDLAEKIVKRYPSSADAYLLLGSVQNAMSEHAAAEISLRQSLNLNPGNSITHAVLAYLFLSQDRFEEAISSAEEAIRLSANPPAFVYLPVFLSEIAVGNRTRALEAGRTYLSKQSEQTEDVINLMVARLAGESDADRRLSPVIAASTNPLAGFSSFVQGPKAQKALRNLLPELGAI